MESSPPEIGAPKDVTVEAPAAAPAAPVDDSVLAYRLDGEGYLVRSPLTLETLGWIRNKWGGVFVFPVKKDLTLPPMPDALVLREVKLVWLPTSQTAIPPGFAVLVRQGGGFEYYRLMRLHLDRGTWGDITDDMYWKYIRIAVEHLWEGKPRPPPPPPMEPVPPPPLPVGDFPCCCTYPTLMGIIIYCYVATCCCCGCCRNTTDDFRDAFP